MWPGYFGPSLIARWSLGNPYVCIFLLNIRKVLIKVPVTYVASYDVIHVVCLENLWMAVKHTFLTHSFINALTLPSHNAP